MTNFRRIAQTLFSSTLFTLALGLTSSQAQALILDHKIGEAKLKNSSNATELNALKSILARQGVATGDLVLDFKREIENESDDDEDDDEEHAYRDGDDDDHDNDDDDDSRVRAGTVPGQWVIDIAPAKSGYFLLKFGIGGTKATADTFFFQNIGDLTQLVFSNEQVQFLTGGQCAKNIYACNIGRLSHVSGFSDRRPAVVVPEPAGLLLMGVGLIALAFGRRRASPSI